MSRRARLIVVPLGLLFMAVPKVNGQRAATKPDMSPHLTLMGFTLERSTLTDVQNKLGATTAGRCSNQEEARKMICYVSKGPDKTRISFESGFSGGWSVLDGFKVASGSLASDCHLQCLAIAAVGNRAETSGGLRLGLTRQELIALLGQPTKVNGNRLTFEWQSTRAMTQAEIDEETQTFKAPVTSPFWDVDTLIEATLADSRLIEFEITRTTTY